MTKMKVYGKGCLSYLCAQVWIIEMDVRKVKESY